MSHKLQRNIPVFIRQYTRQAKDHLAVLNLQDEIAFLPSTHTLHLSPEYICPGSFIFKLLGRKVVKFLNITTCQFS